MFKTHQFRIGALLLAIGAGLLTFQNCSKSSGGGDGAAGGNGATGGGGTPTVNKTQFEVYALGSPLNLGPPGMGGTDHSVLDVVDLDTLTLTRTFDLGVNSASALAVDAANHQVFVNNGTNGHVQVYKTTGGGVIHDLSTLVNTRSLALSPDGSKIYVQSSLGVSSIDPVAFAVESVPLTAASDQPVDMIVSADGKTAASLTFDGSVSHVDFIDLTLMTKVGRTAITTTVAGCGAMGLHLAYGPPGRLLVSDTNCDSLHQIDTGSMTELTADEVKMGRDSMSAFYSVFLYQSSSGEVIQSKESVNAAGEPGLGIIDPVKLTFKLISLSPLSASEMPTGALILGDDLTALVSLGGFNAGASARLRKFDIKTLLPSAPVYALSSAGMPVTKMVIAPK